MEDLDRVQGGVEESVKLLAQALRLLGEAEGDLDVVDTVDRAMEVLGQ